MAYIGKSPSGSGVRTRYYFTQSSGGGTSISGTDDNSKTLTFTDGEYIDVFLNGVLLVAGTDYNTNTANTISGLAALANGDVVEVVVYDIFTVADTVSSLNGGTFSNSVTIDKDGGTALTVDRASSEGTVVDLQKDGTTFGTLGIDGSDLVIDGPSGHTGLRMTTSGLLPRQNGAIIDNTIDLGSGAYRYNDLYLGGNLYIGGTGSANALDDYEEGLFTPSFTSDGTNPTVSYSFQRGFYTKVGRTVYFQIQLGTNSVSVGSGSLFISGLPFTSNASLQSRSGHIGLHYTWATSPVDAKWVLFANDNKFYLYTGDNVGNTLPTSYLDTGSSKNRIWIQGFYDV